MKKVLLVSPPLQSNTQVCSKDNSYGLGLCYLHSVLEREGYMLRTFSYNSSDPVEALKAITTELLDLKPDFFMVQIFTMNRVESYRVLKKARELMPRMKIIAGGVHASIYPEQLLNNSLVDYVVIGEGEATIVELLETLSEGRDPSGVKGIAYKKNGHVVTTAERPLIEDLDSLPFPKHELFITPEREMACILTTRGCPFKCSFCCLHTISKRKFRKRSAKNVVDEVEYIVNTFKNIKIIQIADDTFTLDLRMAMDFCREIIRRKIKVQFLCSARIKPASVELFKLMEDAGFKSIGFGLETGSAKLLKSIHKSITREDVIETFKMLKGINISIHTYLMVGFPGENKETVAETIDLIKRLQKIKYFEFAGVARLWVYPNTEVYEHLRGAGRIDDSFWLTDKDVPFFTLEHTERELERMVTDIAMSCMPGRQWGKRLLNEFLHPLLFAKKFIPRLKKLKNWVIPDYQEENL
ncbi:MAG: B12-binding domain-containing radical SAM protein [Candidatus Omnitrophica bacterium]|nr:B12-binding domain-containing radical SAM protein [Candidatus Omnitrophota bacterium]